MFALGLGLLFQPDSMDCAFGNQQFRQVMQIASHFSIKVCSRQFSFSKAHCIFLPLCHFRGCRHSSGFLQTEKNYQINFSHCSFIFAMISAGTFIVSQDGMPIGNIFFSYMTVFCQKSNVICSQFLLLPCPDFLLSQLYHANVKKSIFSIIESASARLFTITGSDSYIQWYATVERSIYRGQTPIMISHHIRSGFSCCSFPTGGLLVWKRKRIEHRRFLHVIKNIAMYIHK